MVRENVMSVNNFNRCMNTARIYVTLVKEV